MKRLVSVLVAGAVGLQMSLAPARAMTDEEKAAAALAILGIAVLAHGKHHYKDGYRPGNPDAVAEFERGYRDGLHGYAYNEIRSTRDYAEGYQAGDAEREHSMAHRKMRTEEKAPHMAKVGCAEIVARNFGVSTRDVHFVRAESPAKHEWRIEAAVGHQSMVCRVRDTGEVADVRGGRL
jgi:hypothetical protein